MTTVAMQTPKQTEEKLLTEFANTLVDVSWQDLRWTPVANRAIVIQRRGKDRSVLQTISAANTPDAWESWKPVLAEWNAERARTNKRTNHNDFGKGKLAK